MEIIIIILFSIIIGFLISDKLKREKSIVLEELTEKEKRKIKELQKAFSELMDYDVSVAVGRRSEDE